VKKKAHDGDGESFGKIGDAYCDKDEYPKALDWFYLGDGMGDAYSQHKLDWMYEHGRGVRINYSLAMEFYLKAHNNGNVTATNNAGFLYHSGKGVTRDDKTALKWYLESADKRDKCGQFNVGLCYELGLSVRKDAQYALEWYEKSELQGHVAAKCSIKRLNNQGYYIDERQRSNYLAIL
jgi:TPR repeat protein